MNRNVFTGKGRTLGTKDIWMKVQTHTKKDEKADQRISHTEYKVVSENTSYVHSFSVRTGRSLWDIISFPLKAVQDYEKEVQKALSAFQKLHLLSLCYSVHKFEEEVYSHAK